MCAKWEFRMPAPIEDGEEQMVGHVSPSYKLIPDNTQPSARPLSVFSSSFSPEFVIDVKKIVGVLTRVFEHLLRKRTNTPIGKLILFVGCHPAVMLQQVRQREHRIFQDASCLTSTTRQINFFSMGGAHTTCCIPGPYRTY